MKAALCLAILCFAGYASSSQYAWQAGKQYTYSVQARLFSGVAIATQYAGLQVKYDIIVTVTGPNTLHLNPQNFRAVEVHSNINAGWRDGELQNETPVEIKKELLAYLESNIELNMKNGIVDSINIEKGMPTWAENIKKAQVSHLVLDTTGTNAVINGNLNRQTNSVRPDEANQESGFFYETMEETVHGECETYYTVAQNGPFDWPNQFQAQVQPGQNRRGQQQQGQDNSQSQESQQQRDSNESQQQQQQQKQQSQEDSDSQQQSSEEQSYRKHRQYAAYKQLVQRQDSESAEDSRETFQGELPWPRAFADFCNGQDQVYEIVKTVNFTACKNKPVLAYSTNIGLHGRGGDNTLGSALSRSLVTRYLACGKDRKQFTILKIEQEEQVNYGLRLDQNTVAGSVQNVTLRSVENAQRVEPLKSSKKINDLTYTFDPQEQEKQREGKLRSAYFDVMQENDESSSEEQQNEYTTERSYSRQQQQKQQQQQQQQSRQSREDSSEEQQSSRRRHSNKDRRGGRKPRSVDSRENSQQESESQEGSQEGSNEKQWVQTADGQQQLRQPSLNQPPINPLLVSPLARSGMMKRVEALMTEIVDDILTDKEPMAEAETLSKIATVAKILRYLGSSDIQSLYHKLAAKSQTEQDQTARSVFLDAMAIAGTNPNIVTLFNLIKNGEITGEQANQLVMTFPLYIRTPTKQLMREFYNFVQSPVVEKSLQLKSTAVLAFSNTLYQAFVNLRVKNSRYPVAQYGEFGNEGDLQQLYIQYFQKNLREYSQKEQSEGNNKHFTTLYLAAFGNLGVKEIVPEVQRILDDSSDAYIKTRAVLALHRVIVSRSNQNIPVSEGAHVHGFVDRNGQDQLTDEVVEKQVLPVLMSVAFDKGEHPEVRMAAISLLLYTTSADIAVWQQLAYSTWFESSQEVHSFIYSSLKSLVQLDQNVPAIHYKMQKNARAVIAIAKPITPGYTKSRNSFSAGIAEHLQSKYMHQYQYFGSKDSNIPNFIFYKNLVQYGSHAVHVSPLSLTIHGHTIQKLASYALSQYRKQNQNDQAAHKEIEQIYQILGIERREQDDDDIEGSIQIKLRDEMERLISLNQDIIEELTKKAKEQGLPKLMSGIPINYQKTINAQESVFEFPSLLGVPITFNSRMPTHISLRGNVRLVTEGSNFADVQLQAELHPVYAVKTHNRLSFKVPFTGKKYQAGVQRHFVAELPFRALVRKAPSGQIVVAITPSQLNNNVQQGQSRPSSGAQPSGPIPLFTFHQKPYTAIITDSLWPTSHKEGGEQQIVHVAGQQLGQQLNQQQAQQQQFQRNVQFGQRALGLIFKSEEISEYRTQNERNPGWVRFWQRFHSAECFFQLGWLGGEKVRYVERKLILDVQNSETKTLAFIVAGKRQQSASAKDLWQDSSSQSSQSTEESASSESSSDSSSQQERSNEIRDNNKSSSSSSRQERNRSSASGASQSAEDYSQEGYIVAAAMIGKRIPIRPVEDGKASIQKILQKGSPSTVQYLAQVSKSQGRVYIRVASGDAANEAAKQLPQTSNSLQALREAIVDSPNTKAQPDGCAEFEGEYDAPSFANRGQLLVLRKQLLEKELVVKIKAELQFGQSCKSMPHEIKVQGKLERGQQMTEWAKIRSRQAQKCAEDEKKGFNTSPVCIWVAEHQAAALNKGDLKFTFTQMPKQFMNRTDDVEDFFKALLYPYLSTDRFHEGAGDNKLRAEFYLTPNKQFLDVHITKPHSKISFRSIRTNRVIQSVLPLTATNSLVHNIKDRALRSEGNPFCSIENNYVNTFDNVTYRFSSEAGQNCYHVMAQDFSGKHPVAVLVKDVSTSQKKVVIYLNAKTKIELTPQGSGSNGNAHAGQREQQRSRLLGNTKMHVDINEQRVESLPRVVRSKSTGRIIARIEPMNDQGIQVFSRHFDIAANGQYVVVYASNSLRNRTGGFCGNFNGERTGDMRSPKNCPLSSGSLLVASYAIKPQAIESSDKGQCQVSALLKKQIQVEDTQCLQDPAHLPNNPRKFPNSQIQPADFNVVGDSACIQKMTDSVRSVVYNTVKTVLKPLTWFPTGSSLREKGAKKCAEYVAGKVHDALSGGSAQKISELLASALCTAIGYVPVVGTPAKAACNLGKSWITKGLLMAVNPICKSTGCCTPSSSALYMEAEWEQTLNFAFAEEAGIREDSQNAYLTDAEIQQSCEKKFPLLMSRAIGHIVHYNLFEKKHLNQHQRNRLAEKAKDEIEQSLKKTLKKGHSISTQVVDAVERAMPSNVQIDRHHYEQAAQTIQQQFCAEKQCCFPGQE